MPLGLWREWQAFMRMEGPLGDERFDSYVKFIATHASNRFKDPPMTFPWEAKE